MKIAIDIREAAKGRAGKGWYTYNLVSELLKLDKENQYILYTDQEENGLSPHKNAEVRLITEPSWKWHLAVIKDLKKEKPDLFFAPTSYIIPALVPKSIKTVITVHDLVAYYFPKTHSLKATLIERSTLRKALKKASAVLVVSENTKKDLLKKFRYPENKIFVTYCAASDVYKHKPSEHELEDIQKRLKLPANFILGVSTLEPRKNFALLIKSFVVIKRKFPEYKLVLVGKRGWKMKAIEEAVQHYQLQDDVIFTGYLEDQDLRRIYALAKVFVFPSLYEGFGIPPLEAMASGCPVVSSNAASLPEVVGEAGLLIDPTNSLKFADAIASIITNEHLRQMFIERGKEQAEKFSWVESAKTALAVFREVAGSKDSPDQV